MNIAANRVQRCFDLVLIKLIVHPLLNFVNNLSDIFNVFHVHLLLQRIGHCVGIRFQVHQLLEFVCAQLLVEALVHILVKPLYLLIHQLLDFYQLLPLVQLALVYCRLNLRYVGLLVQGWLDLCPEVLDFFPVALALQHFVQLPLKPLDVFVGLAAELLLVLLALNLDVSVDFEHFVQVPLSLILYLL